MVSITFFSGLYIGHLVLFLLFLLVLGTQWIVSLVPSLLVSVLFPYYILLSFDFVLYSCPGFVIVLVFLGPHINLVYLAFFILFSIFKVSHLYLCFGPWCALYPCPLDPPLTTWPVLTNNLTWLLDSFINPESSYDLKSPRGGIWYTLYEVICRHLSLTGLS